MRGLDGGLGLKWGLPTPPNIIIALNSPCMFLYSNKGIRRPHKRTTCVVTPSGSPGTPWVVLMKHSFIYPQLSSPSIQNNRKMMREWDDGRRKKEGARLLEEEESERASVHFQSSDPTKKEQEIRE